MAEDQESPGERIRRGWVFFRRHQKGDVQCPTLGARRKAKAVYTGSVGTGFTQSEAKQIYQVLQAIHTPECPFTTVPDLKRFIYWCHPKLVCQVEYGEFTTDGKLRYPVYLRPREDKDPEATPQVGWGAKPSRFDLS